MRRTIGRVAAALAVSAALCSVVLAGAPKPGAEEPKYFKASELDLKAGPLTRIAPKRPAGSEKMIGRVVARVLINEKGRADAVRIESSGPEPLFVAPVKAAFGAARYRPGRKDGRSVKSQMLVEVTFDAEVEAPPPASRRAR